MWREERFQLYPFTCEYSIGTAPFIAETFISPFNVLGTLFENQLTTKIKAFFLYSQLYSIDPYDYLITVSNCLDYSSLNVKFEVVKGESSSFDLLCEDYIGYFGFFTFYYNF